MYDVVHSCSLILWRLLARGFWSSSSPPSVSASAFLSDCKKKSYFENDWFCLRMVGVVRTYCSSVSSRSNFSKASMRFPEVIKTSTVASAASAIEIFRKPRHRSRSSSNSPFSFLFSFLSASFSLARWFSVTSRATKVSACSSKPTLLASSPAREPKTDQAIRDSQWKVSARRWRCENARNIIVEPLHFSHIKQQRRRRRAAAAAATTASATSATHISSTEIYNYIPSIVVCSCPPQSTKQRSSLLACCFTVYCLERNVLQGLPSKVLVYKN